MNPIVIFILGALAGGLMAWLFFCVSAKKHSNILKNIGMFGTAKENKKTPGLIERQAKEKEESKKKLLGLFGSNEKISNDIVENSLGVSDATATRYLNELEAEGKIRQVGKTGSGVYYEMIENERLNEVSR